MTNCPPYVQLSTSRSELIRDCCTLLQHILFPVALCVDDALHYRGTEHPDCGGPAWAAAAYRELRNLDGRCP